MKLFIAGTAGIFRGRGILLPIGHLVVRTHPINDWVDPEPDWYRTRYQSPGPGALQKTHLLKVRASCKCEWKHPTPPVVESGILTVSNKKNSKA